jgi:uncharacterized OB-fold protein
VPDPRVTPPDLTDPLFAPYWAGAAAEQLVLPDCAHCGALRWPPRALCRSCGEPADLDWKPRPAQGVLHSWTVVGHATAPGFTEVPYVVGLIELAGGARTFGTVLAEPADLRIDLALGAEFHSFDEFTVIQWRPRQGSTQ